MNQLAVIENGIVPVYQGENQGQLVNARELHEKLESNTKFADWIKYRLEKYDFIEGEDFFLIFGKSTGGRPTNEYLFKLDAAKEIAMVENNDQGKAIRKYFIEVEKKARAMFVVPQTLPEALRMAADLAEQLDKQKPLVAFAESCTASKDSLLVRELAKLAAEKQAIDIGEKRLYKKLRDWKMIFPHSTEPYQEYIDRGYFEVTQSAKDTMAGTKLFRVTRVTPKGQIYIIDRLKKEA